MKEAFATGETVALAKLKASEILGLNSDELGFEIIQNPQKKKFGLFGGKMAQVRAFVKETPATKAVNYLKEVLYYMGMDEFEVKQEDFDLQNCLIRIDGKNLKHVVGCHGETLDALEYLAGLVANEDNDGHSYCKIRLEAGGYRDKRRKSLSAYARRKAYESVKMGQKIHLEPMRSYDRKVVHLAVKDITGINSWSEGQDRERHVVLAPAEQEAGTQVKL